MATGNEAPAIRAAGIGKSFPGVTALADIQNGMVLLDINPFVQQIVRGAAVLIAVLISQARGTWK